MAAISRPGKAFLRHYMQAYIDLLEAGGDLGIHTHMTTGLLDELLDRGPFLATVNYAVLHGPGRYRETGPRQIVPDDVNGVLYNHLVVVYGRDSRGSYLLADPFKAPGRHVVDSEHLLCAMTAAQTECENTLFQIKPNQ
ncbi:MAG: hypothetical protein JWN01_516 [Patescibacteria group bacterium]|nr:hypothetical protein [Patescibacteria group bacterium]